MKVHFILAVLLLAACRSAEDSFGCEDLFDQLPKLQPGYSLDTVNDDPKSLMAAKGSCLETHFEGIAGLVGYFTYGDVTVILTSYPGDDIYPIATTFRNGVKVDGVTLSLGYGGFIGCGYNHIEEVLVMTSPTTMTTVQKTIIADCDANDEEIPGTAKTAIVRTTFEFTESGKIVQTESTSSGS